MSAPKKIPQAAQLTAKLPQPPADTPPAVKVPVAQRKKHPQELEDIFADLSKIEQTSEEASRTHEALTSTEPIDAHSAFGQLAAAQGVTITDAGSTSPLQLSQLNIPVSPETPATAPPLSTAPGLNMSTIFGGMALVGLAAGGGGGESSAGINPGPTTPGTTEIGGTLINGYIANATVFQDNDRDGIRDADEPSTTTDEKGKFTLDVSPDGGPLVAVAKSDTVDRSTGAEVTSTFKAPLNATVISPLSTLVVAGLTESQIKTAFGIDSDIDLLDFNPISSALLADDPTVALQYKAASVMVSNLMDVGNSLIGGATNQSSDTSALVIRGIVKVITDQSGQIDLRDTNDVKSVLTESLRLATGSTDSAVLDTISDNVASANAAVVVAAEEASTSGDARAALEMIAKIELVTQTTLANGVNAAARGSTTALNNFDLEEAVDDAVVPEIPAIFKGLSFDELVAPIAKGQSGGAATLVTQTDGNDLLKFDKSAGSAGQYAHLTLSTSGASGTPKVDPISLSAGDAKLGMWVHTAQAGTKVRLQIGDSAAGGYPYDNHWVEVEVSTTKAGWEYLTFDFENPVSRFIANGAADGSRGYTAVTELNPGVTYDMVAVFFDLGVTKLAAETYYLDKLTPLSLKSDVPPEAIDFVTVNPIPEGYELVLNDEFNSGNTPTAPDNSVWKLETGRGPNGDGWGNGESQVYESGLDDAYLQNGNLHIIAKRTGDTITSARLKSQLGDTLDPYGYVEVKAKLPAETGAWPAIWLLGQGEWPKSGEIDIVEWSAKYFKDADGNFLDQRVEAALHFYGNGNQSEDYLTSGNTQFKNGTTLADSVENFHTYQLWWTPTSIRIGVDGNINTAYLEYTKPENATSDDWPFTNPMDIILNLAIGGTLGGTLPDGNFQYEMVVDYVRVYQSGEPSGGNFTTLDFEDSSALTITGFEGAGNGDGTNGWGSSAITADPLDSNNTVVKVVKSAEAQPWAGTTVNPDAPIVFDANHKVLSLRVYSEEADIPVVLKLEGAGVQVITQKSAAGWQDLNFDFSSFITSNAVSLGTPYDAVSVFVNFNTAEGAPAQGQGQTYYFDDLTLGEAYNPPVALTTLDFEDSSALTITGFEGAGNGDGTNGWGSSAITADPLDSNNTVVKVVKSAEAQPWAGTTVNPDAPIVFDANHKVLSLRVYSEEADIPVVLKLEGAGVQVITQKSAAGWQDLNFDFSSFITSNAVSLGTPYDAVSVFVNFNTAEGAPAQGQGQTYYFDDLTLGEAYNPPVALTTLDFEDSSALTITGFEGAGNGDGTNGWGSSAITADPLDSNNTVVKVVKSAEAQPWAGTTVNPDAPIVFDANHKVLSLRVYSEEADIPVVLKLEGAGVQVITQKSAAGWQDLNFDFSSFITSNAVSLGTPYDAVSVFVNFNTAEGAPAQGQGQTYYFDDLTLGEAYNPPVALTTLDFEDSSALTITGFEGAGNGDGTNGWGSSAITADPLDSNNTVVKVVKSAEAQPWAGTTVNPDAPIVFDANHKVLSLRVYSEEADIPVVLKLEGAGVQVITQKSAAGWQDLNFDFSSFITSNAVSLGTPYDAVSVFVNFNTAEGAPAQGQGQTYYFDDLTLGEAYNPPVALTTLDFEDSSALTITGFEGAGNGDGTNGWGSSAITADPLDSNNTVVKVVKSAEAQPWAGTTVNPDAPIVFDANHKVLSLRVYSEEADIPVVLKLEGAGVQVITQKSAAGWQDLNFDFSSFITSNAVSLGTPYDAVSVFVNFNTAEGAPAQGQGQTYYFDDLTLGEAYNPPVALTTLDFEDSSALTITGFEGAGNGDGTNGWGSSAITADPLDSNNTVVKVVKSAEAQPWAGTTVNPDAPIVFDANHKVLSLRVYSEEADIPVVLKLEGAGVQVITQKSAAGWQDLNFDFSSFITSNAVSLGTPYDAVSVFVNFNTAEGAPAQGQGQTYYFDDLTLGEAPTTAAPEPTQEAADVISLFSDSYSNADVDHWSTDWDMVDLTQVLLENNQALKYTNLSYAGVEFTSEPIDASNMTHLHLDLWKQNPDSIFKLKLVDFGANGIYQGGDDVEHELIFNQEGSPSLAGNQWVSLDIPLSEMTALTTRAHLAQMIISGSGAGDTVWLDNIYLYDSTRVI